MGNALLLLCIIIFSLISTIQSNQDDCKYISAQTLFELSALNKVSPEPKNCWGGDCEIYVWGSSEKREITAPQRCFGFRGPLSSIGPLGPIGPLGDGTYSPEKVFKLIGNWETYKKIVMADKGPLEHPKGPMSIEGPLGDAFWNVMPHINDFTKHMYGLGIWSILGPIGPLGALGGLGPIGPLGAHGYGRNSKGDYIDKKGNIVTSVMAAWNSTHQKRWPLFEKYTLERALELSNLGKLDTSFMVEQI